jgi:hypothetical protein
VTQFQPITRKDIPDWAIELWNAINEELASLDTLIEEAMEKYFKIQMVLPEMAKTYKGLIIGQNEICDDI